MGTGFSHILQCGVFYANRRICRLHSGSSLLLACADEERTLIPYYCYLSSCDEWAPLAFNRFMTSILFLAMAWSKAVLPLSSMRSTFAFAPLRSSSFAISLWPLLGCGHEGSHAISTCGIHINSFVYEPLSKIYIVATCNDHHN